MRTGAVPFDALRLLRAGSSGLAPLSHFYPALPYRAIPSRPLRRASLAQGRLCGARIWQHLLHRLSQVEVLTHTLKRCASQSQAATSTSSAACQGLAKAQSLWALSGPAEAGPFPKACLSRGICGDEGTVR